MSYHFLLQGIFPTQGSNPGLLHWRQILYHLSHQGRPCSFLVFVESINRKVAQTVKNSAYNMGDLDSTPELGRSPGEGNGNPVQYSCWRIPWREEPDGLQSVRSQRVRHAWTTNTSSSNCMRLWPYSLGPLWRSPVFLIKSSWNTKIVSHLKHFSVRVFASCRKIVGRGAGQKFTGINACRNNLPTIKVPHPWWKSSLSR